MSRWYLVQSGEWEEVDPVLDDGSGPSKTVRAFLRVRAATQARAKVVALRCWRRREALPWNARDRDKLRGYTYGTPDFLYPGENPFRGMRVERLTHQDVLEWLEGCA